MERTYKIVKRDRQGLDAVRRPTAIEVAWAAGIYEGEGSCVTAGEKRNSFDVRICQKDPELLYRLRDLFGGSVKSYDRKFNGVVRPISHWKISGDRGRTFIGVIYPFLTARRKEQIDATSAGDFIELAQDLIRFDCSLGQSQVYESLWVRLNEYDVQQREKAREHKKQRETEWYANNKQEPAYKERKLAEQRKHRKLKKEQLQASVTKLVAIA
jgi:hypothetical protein